MRTEWITDPKTGRRRKALDLDRTVVRFNWGFHDAVWDYQRQARRPDGLEWDTIIDRHFDPAYAMGYAAGWRAARSGEDTTSSEQAWESYQTVSLYLRAEYAPYRPQGETEKGGGT